MKGPKYDASGRAIQWVVENVLRVVGICFLGGLLVVVTMLLAFAISLTFLPILFMVGITSRADEEMFTSFEVFFEMESFYNWNIQALRRLAAALGD